MFKIFEVVHDETDWVVANTPDEALQHVKDFHEIEEGEVFNPTINEVPESEWEKNQIRIEGDNGEDEYITFRKQIDDLKGDPAFELPYYLCGTMF